MAKKGRKKTDEIPDLTYLSEANLSEGSFVQTARSRGLAENPMEKHVLKSWQTNRQQVGTKDDGTVIEQGQAYDLPVTAGVARYVEGLLRRAAETNGLGVKVQFFNPNGPSGYELVQGTQVPQMRENAELVITFAAQTRREKRRSGQSATETDSETAAKVEAQNAENVA